jgi:O-antigen/teichoic acid export membrane protein
MNLPLVGALAFGIVIGWVTYRTLRRRTDAVGLSDIATVIGAVGGAAVTALFDTDDLFGAYCIGLFIGFFVYLIGAVTILRDVGWLSSD